MPIPTKDRSLVRAAMQVLGRIKTPKKAASSTKNLRDAERKRRLDKRRANG